MERSRKLILTNWSKANTALQKHFEGNKSELAKKRKVSRTTVTAFFKCEPVREAEFRKIAFGLYLDEKDWQVFSDSAIAVPCAEENEPQQEDWIAEVRSRCCEKILYQHSTIRLLNQTEIRVDQLYVDVWLLDPSSRPFYPPKSMSESFDLRNDRLGMGDRVKQDEGVKVANDKTRLLILGRPGTGKTTFLKHLAVDCSNGKFQPNLIPVLIELRGIESTQWKLIDAISGELNLDNQKTQALLEQGKLLILMDGLDEVPTSNFRRIVQDQVRNLTQEPKYSDNRFILTCRTQIIEVIPKGFASVEVADFNKNQVKKFVENWFCATGLTKADSAQQWKRFSDAIEKNPALNELTVTPILLSLMCLFLQDRGDLPTQTAELYEKGIQWLLKRWNDRKEIPEWEIGTQIYRELELEQTEALLIEIAARKFENLDNFVLFEQRDLAKQITNFLNLSDVRNGEAVLKAIEAQHGLLVERADELWSFSHLTFQEYFVARKIVDRETYEPLLENIADKRWREVCLLTVEMLLDASDLLQRMKQRIDSLIASDEKLQRFLTWVMQKSTGVPYNIPAVRAFYGKQYHLLYALDRSLSRDFALYYEPAIDPEVERAYDDFLESLRLQEIYSIYSDVSFTESDSISAKSCSSSSSNISLDWNLALDFDLEMFLAHWFNEMCAEEVYWYIPDVKFWEKEPTLKRKLELLIAQLQPHLEEDWESWCEWWKANKQTWTSKLRADLIEHRNIGHDWQFSDAQEEKLRQYYDANRLLVDCLNTARNIDRTRQEIEDNLLLPIATLRERLPELYGE